MQRVLDPRVSGWAMILAWTVACAGGGGRRERFGTTDCGEAVSVFTLKNAHGMALRVTDYGGIILTLLVPDKNGRLDDVVLGYDSLTGYLRSSPYFGALIGRYGNRIAHGRFTLDGKTYTLATNNGDRKSTRLNSSHSQISYAVFCLKKKKLREYGTVAPYTRGLVRRHR